METNQKTEETLTQMGIPAGAVVWSGAVLAGFILAPLVMVAMFPLALLALYMGLALWDEYRRSKELKKSPRVTARLVPFRGKLTSGIMHPNLTPYKKGA